MAWLRRTGRRLWLLAVGSNDDHESGSDDGHTTSPSATWLRSGRRAYHRLRAGWRRSSVICRPHPNSSRNGSLSDGGDTGARCHGGSSGTALLVRRRLGIRGRGRTLAELRRMQDLVPLRRGSRGSSGIGRSGLGKRDRRGRSEQRQEDEGFGHGDSIARGRSPPQPRRSRRWSGDVRCPSQPSTSPGWVTHKATCAASACGADSAARGLASATAMRDAVTGARAPCTVRGY